MISSKTFNVVKVCVYLAGQRPLGYVTTTELSIKLDLSISCLENLLKPLKAHGIVSTMKGPGGGYMIQGDTSLISIWDIASVFERTFVAANSAESSLCTELLDDKAPPASFELDLEQIVVDTLSHSTLADFSDESRNHEASSFVQPMGRFKFKPITAPLMPKAPNSVFQLSRVMA